MTNKNKISAFNPQRIAFILLIIVSAFFLWTEHKAHIMGILPYLILLLCPLMHFFMHKGHGKHDEPTEHDAPNHDQRGAP